MNPHKYRQEVTNMQVQELVGIVPWNFIATICNLFIQVYLIKRFFFKPINEMLDKRKAKADAEIQDAVKAKEEAQAMKEEYEKNMQEAKNKANDIVMTAQKTAAIQSEEMIKEASSQVTAMKEKAEKDIAQEKRKAVNEIKEEIGGIGVAVSDRPEGPYKDLLGKPLINEIVNGAQPIDQFVYNDNGHYYMYYGGWGHCNVVQLNDDFTGLVTFEDGTVYKEVTPENYVEGPFMFKKDGKYYFMWSEGGWGGPDYSVAYAISDSPFGPFKRVAKILQQDPSVATSAGHHSLLHAPGTDDYYIVYHRRPLNDNARDHRVTCIDKMTFDKDGFINPVKMTFEGVPAQKIKKSKKK